jgi:DNA replication and repair protein RecF
VTLRSLILSRISIHDIRAVARASFNPAPRINVIHGRNGHGKTTVLEAIYILATSRSFRTSRPSDVVRLGASCAVVRGRFAEEGGARPGISREQTATVQGNVCAVQVDGKRPARLSDYATRSPVVVFHPDEMALSTGPAIGRRTLLDRLALFMDPASSEHRARYAHALRSRQRLLHEGLEGRGELEVFEELCAEHGAALTRARRAAAEELAGRLGSAFAQIAAPDLTIAARFDPGGAASAEEARAELRSQRIRDARRPSAGFGPHRDDLVLLLDGQPARTVASQGQHRALTLALKVGEMATIAAARSIEPILLLDDVSSELDEERTAALFAFLGRTPGQVFVTTTRPELITTLGGGGAERLDWHVDAGAIGPGDRS